MRQNLENQPLKVFPISPGNYAKGSKVEYVGDFLGRGFSTIVIVTRAEPDTSLELVADDPFPLKMRLDLKMTMPERSRFRVQSVVAWLSDAGNDCCEGDA